MSNLLDESGVSASFVIINYAAQVAFEIMVHQSHPQEVKGTRQDQERTQCFAYWNFANELS